MWENGKLTSESLADLIVDALIDARIIQEDNRDRAIDIATEEINARKAAGDY
jgi:hypothetical protein